MNNIYSWYKSGAVWTVVLMFLVGGFQNITSFLPAGGEQVVLLILGIVASYLHVNLAQNLGASN